MAFFRIAGGEHARGGIGGVIDNSDYLAIFDTERAVRELRPDMTALMRLDCLGIIATAPGDHCDFVSRFFAPRAGIPEDPV